jgi:hypothetical protein
MVDYRDWFLFLMLKTFFPPENVGNFHNRPEPNVFYGERPNNIIRKIEKKKKYYGYVIFFIHLTFFLFCPNVFFFFILASVCRPSIRENILWGIRTLHVHLSDCFFVSPINIKS